MHHVYSQGWHSVAQPLVKTSSWKISVDNVPVDKLVPPALDLLGAVLDVPEADQVFNLDDAYRVRTLWPSLWSGPVPGRSL